MWQNIAIGVIIYLALCYILYRIQDKFIFHPEKLPQNFNYQYSFPFKELFFDIKPGVRINGLHFLADEFRGIVIYFHGNTRSIKGWGKYSKDFTVHGYDVVMVDYRGFGKSTGKRSEKELKEDAQFLYNSLKEKFGEKNLIVYGRSIGSGFAAKLASTNNPKMLIMDAPYYSFSNLTKRFLPILPVKYILKYPIKTNVWLRYVKCPIHIIHGTKDSLIPFTSSVELAKVAPHLTKLILIHGGRHNNLPSFPEYHEKLKEILLGEMKLHDIMEGNRNL